MISNILIVDDREFDRLLYKEFLGDQEYVFIELDDGEEIISTLRKTKIDLILLDWQMPRLGGLEVLKLLRSNTDLSNIPVVVITGLQDDTVLEKVFDFGGVDFINKPVSSVEINSRVSSVLRFQKAQKELREQKEQLEEMNLIISEQKKELEKTLLLKSEIAALKEEKLNTEIQSTKRQLISFELDSTKVSKELKEIRTGLKELIDEMTKANDTNGYRTRISRLMKSIDQIYASQDSLDDFKLVFENLDPEFFKKLSSRNQKLTSLDLKHCAYIKLNLDNYEISNILNVEAKSIQMTRYRIKKKLKLDGEMSLKEFIHTL